MYLLCYVVDSQAEVSERAMVGNTQAEVPGKT